MYDFIFLPFRIYIHPKNTLRADCYIPSSRSDGPSTGLSIGAFSLTVGYMCVCVCVPSNQTYPAAPRCCLATTIVKYKMYYCHCRRCLYAALCCCYCCYCHDGGGMRACRPAVHTQ